MKNTPCFVPSAPQFCRALAAGIFALASLPALATTFTNNTTIGVSNTNYEGADIVVTNCTLTVDGPHVFSSLLVAAGGVVTHSFYPGGSISNLLFITNESQTLSGTNPATLLNSNVVSETVSVTDASSTTVYTNGLDYLLSSSDGILTQLQRTTNSNIPDGTNVLVSYEVLLSITPSGLNLAVSNNVQVAVGGAINVNGKGYDGGLGAGAGRSAGNPQDGSGAGYGGSGGMSSSNAVGGATYGSFTQPANLGSGGGSSYGGLGGAGGGLIQIVAGGDLIIAGSISADGANATNSRSGGGSGGGVWLTAHRLFGAGVITAYGGSGEPTHGGGGGGGRIALQYDATSFTGPMAAYSGVGAKSGGAGTIYTRLTGQNGLLVVDNGGQSGTNTSVTVANNAIDVLIRGNAGVMPLGSAWTVGNLTIASNGLLLAGSSSLLNLTAAGNITIQAGGGLLADGAGYPAGIGQGAGRFYGQAGYNPCGGGGYGGGGGSGFPTNATGGTTYGSQLSPIEFGSGGGNFVPSSIGGSGGGAIRITSLNGIVQVDGKISANGKNGSGSGGGGGAGGSIWLTGGTLLGSGSITAKGGNGVDSIGGGGGGGRIAISPAANLFGGTITAYGGGGANWGGAGTVFVLVQGQNGQLILDNGGRAGANTLVQSASGTDLIVRSGAVASASTSVSFANLIVSSNGWLTPSYTYSPASSLNLSFSGNATVQAGGGITADLAGYAPGQGPGLGRSYSLGSSNLCSGAGHGGYGANSYLNLAAGGSTYDSITAPVNPGSGGGNYTGPSLGGAGGGVIRLTVTGTLQLDGVISANAGSGSGVAGGGGSGGSIWLAVGTLAGGGFIAASGGNGADGLGGGGGGGMIYIPCNNNSFSGSLAAYGGGGANWGGAGAILIQVSGQHGQLTLDNAGHTGAVTPLQSSSTVDLTLRNGAIGTVLGSLNLGNVLIGPNAWLLASNSPTLTFSSATIQAGGGILADSAGYAAGAGPGAGHYIGSSPNYACSGAGHGGNGGNSAGNSVTGGIAYDSQASPVSPGSGGGTEPPYSVGGAGGGALRLTVTGLLQLDGVVSANGGAGFGQGGGGGSGGSISLTAGTLAGGGSITANGGGGAASVGGGGAGGCIAISPTLNLFAGALSAYGGGGANWGGAGTVEILTSPSAPSGQLILDNGGRSGAATPIQSLFSGALILRNGAVGYQQFPPQTFASLLIGSNAWLTANPTLGNNYPGIVNLTLTGNATIQTGGGVVTDGMGSAGGNGVGAGRISADYYTFPCSGAGYGGNGAMSSGNKVAGGSTYGPTAFPTSLGSGGGNYVPYSFGGAGGGSVRLTVNGALESAGTISANGGNGSGSGGGGGSGGSVWLTVGTLAGAGSITASGGSGADTVGGGGGGGRISISYNNNSFAGAISAYGGGGANWGGAGTVYLKANSQSYGQLMIDNGGRAGTNTTFDATSTDLLVTGRAVAQWPSSSGTVRNLQIRSNSVLTTAVNVSPLRPGNVTVNITGNATIDAGGAISADGTMSGTGGSPVGVGFSAYGGICGGGGHGGFGAANPSGFGAAYDTVTAPLLPGSPGGNGSGSSAAPYGGAGGGAIYLQVTGTLAMNGRVSAAGKNGDINSGGGSGGSLWVSAGTLAGSGILSVNGGDGNGLGGGGGGGRISIGYNANAFTGVMTAYGGGGYARGGAGTIFTQANNRPGGLILVDNGGAVGTNTPFSSTFFLPCLNCIQAFNLILGNGAIVSAQPGFPVLSNLTVSAGGLLTSQSSQSSLDLVVLNNVDVAPGGVIAVDGQGFSQGNGPGAGQSVSGNGSGAGYGGIGGASAAGAGGPSYGSAQQPADFGSGGGFGSGPTSGGSEGGGAIRLSVGGILTVDGQISADGDVALQDNAGGGSGGSIWVTTGTLAGSGRFSADGGAGDPYNGGGGAGGRIALYYSANIFSGMASASGAEGYSWGADGTIFYSTNFAPLQIISSSPSGVVSNGVSSVDLFFNAAPNPNSFNGSTLSLTTPNGPYSGFYISISVLSSTHYRANLALQTEVGPYTFTVATNITDLYGQPMSQVYTGAFTISLPVIQGFVRDTNGQPVSGVLLQPTAGLSPTTTDTNGNYALGFLPGSIFTVTPSQGALVFVPASLSYSNITDSISNQNYLAVSTIAATLSAGGNTTNPILSWRAIPGVTYQVYYSTNLADWLPYSDPFIGSNGPVQMPVPNGGDAMRFFRVRSSN